MFKLKICFIRFTKWRVKFLIIQLRQIEEYFFSYINIYCFILFQNSMYLWIWGWIWHWKRVTLRI